MGLPFHGRHTTNITIRPLKGKEDNHELSLSCHEKCFLMNRTVYPGSSETSSFWTHRKEPKDISSNHRWVQKLSKDYKEYLPPDCFLSLNDRFGRQKVLFFESLDFSGDRNHILFSDLKVGQLFSFLRTSLTLAAHLWLKRKKEVSHPLSPGSSPRMGWCRGFLLLGRAPGRTHQRLSLALDPAQGIERQQSSFLSLKSGPG